MNWLSNNQYKKMSQFHPDYSAEIVINNIDDSDDSDNNSSSSNLTEKLKILNSNLQKDALIKKNREKLNKPVTVFVTNENGNISGLMNGDFSSTSSTNLSSIKEVSSSDSFGKKELPIMPKPLSLNNSSEAIDENFVKSHIVSIDETLENCQSEFSESNNPKNKFDYIILEQLYQLDYHLLEFLHLNGMIHFLKLHQHQVLDIVIINLYPL